VGLHVAKFSVDLSQISVTKTWLMQLIYKQYHPKQHIARKSRLKKQIDLGTNLEVSQKFKFEASNELDYYIMMMCGLRISRLAS
jgi:hypothetical protein